MADNCVTTFNELNLKHTMKNIVYGMNDGMTEIQVSSPTFIFLLRLWAEMHFIRASGRPHSK